MGHIYIYNAQKLPILSHKVYGSPNLLVFRLLCLLFPVFDGKSANYGPWAKPSLPPVFAWLLNEGQFLRF